MIRRFFSILLVFLMLVNQGFSFAHTHLGTDTGQSEGHASRAHFHVSGHGQAHSTHDQKHHANHSHGDHSGRGQGCDDHDAAVTPGIAPSGDHDADAVYCAETVIFARNGNSLNVPSAKHVVLCRADQNHDWLPHLGPPRGQPISVFDAACPIYLRTLSLRI